MVTSSTPKFKVGPELKRASRINLRDLTKDIRFEASAYGLKSIKAQDELRDTGCQLKPVYGEGGLARLSHNAFQFARCYVSSEYGVPFMGSSDIIFVDFRPSKFLSRKNTKRLEQLMIQPWDVLLSCSGTVGNVALAPPSWNSIALSQHVLRIRFDDPIMAGFITAFLRSPWGRAQTVGSSYGSVISHIEPHHLERVLVPLLPADTIKIVGTAFCRAAEARAEANRLLREAEGIFENLSARETSLKKDKSQIIKLSELDFRFEGSFHSRNVVQILDEFSSVGIKMSKLSQIYGDVIIPPTLRFSRVYAKKGVPFVSSKEILQIDPIGQDRLSATAHADLLDSITLRSRELVVSRSGTLGRCILVPNYMEGWACTEHLLRITNLPEEQAAFLSAWIGSVPGQAILLRYAYGSVIQHINSAMLRSLPVPILSKDKNALVSQLVLQAIQLRESAWKAEHDALALLTKTIKPDSRTDD